MRHLSPIHVVLAVHATCAGANLVLALVWSSWVLALAGAGWALVAALLFAFHGDGPPPDEVGPAEARADEAAVLPGA